MTYNNFNWVEYYDNYENYITDLNFILYPTFLLNYIKTIKL